jgi:hypothetical protein
VFLCGCLMGKWISKAISSLLVDHTGFRLSSLLFTAFLLSGPLLICAPATPAAIESDDTQPDKSNDGYVGSQACSQSIWISIGDSNRPARDGRCLQSRPRFLARTCRDSGLGEAGDAAIGGIPQQSPDDRAFPASSRLACRDAFGVEPTCDLAPAAGPDLQRRSAIFIFQDRLCGHFHMEALGELDQRGRLARDGVLFALRQFCLGFRTDP